MTTPRMPTLDIRVGHLERDVEAIKVGQAQLGQGQNALASKMDEIGRAIAGFQATKGPPLSQILDTATRLIMIIGATVAGIVYIARNGSSHEAHAFDLRLSAIERTITRVDEALAWRPTLAPPSK